MAAGNFIVYDTAKKLLLSGGIDLDTDTIKCALVTSSYTFDITHDEWADASTNEVANGNGYATGGVTVTLTVTNTGSTTKVTTSGPPSWTASGAGITARRAIFYKSGSGGGLTNPLIGSVLLDSAPADVSASAGYTLTVTPNASGFFTLTGATS